MGLSGEQEQMALEGYNTYIEMQLPFMKSAMLLNNTPKNTREHKNKLIQVTNAMQFSKTFLCWNCIYNSTARGFSTNACFKIL